MYFEIRKGNRKKKKKEKKEKPNPNRLGPLGPLSLTLNLPLPSSCTAAARGKKIPLPPSRAGPTRPSPFSSLLPASSTGHRCSRSSNPSPTPATPAPPPALLLPQPSPPLSCSSTRAAKLSLLPVSLCPTRRDLARPHRAPEARRDPDRALKTRAVQPARPRAAPRPCASRAADRVEPVRFFFASNEVQCVRSPSPITLIHERHERHQWCLKPVGRPLLSLPRRPLPSPPSLYKSAAESLSLSIPKLALSLPRSPRVHATLAAASHARRRTTVHRPSIAGVDTITLGIRPRHRSLPRRPWRLTGARCSSPETCPNTHCYYAVPCPSNTLPRRRSSNTAVHPKVENNPKS
jgi:hypothetical protein